MGLTGPNGKELTMRVLDGIFGNIKWRYRGQRMIDLDKHCKGQSALPTTEKQIIVKLPHGSIIDDKLLDQVQEKLDHCAKRPIKAGKNGRIYLLSGLLRADDGSRFQGQLGKNIMYYVNPTKKISIHCDKIDKLVISEIKKQVFNDARFSELVEASIKLRQIDLPKFDRHKKASRIWKTRINSSARDFSPQKT